jgi:hypothetical protein
MHVAVSTRSSIKRGAEARRRTGRWWTASGIASAGGRLDEWSARRLLAPLRRLEAVTWPLERDGESRPGLRWLSKTGRHGLQHACRSRGR